MDGCAIRHLLRDISRLAVQTVGLRMDIAIYVTIVHDRVGGALYNETSEHLVLVNTVHRGRMAITTENEYYDEKIEK